LSEVDLPLVSIVIPSHDYGQFLGEAIESALGQTHPRCEVIVVDDGSTDDSRAVAARYGDRITLFTQGDEGVESAVNRGVSEASGEYVARLDADDVLEPTYVEEHLAALRRSPDAAYAYCPARQFGARTGVTRCFPFSAYIMARRTNYVHGSALLARSDFLGAGGYESLGAHANEDWDFWLRLLESGKRGTFVHAPLLRWRRHGGGSRNPEGERLERSIAVLHERHSALMDAVSGPRATIAYWLDLATAVADLVVGFSRSPRVVRYVERRSWRRFQRRHARRLQAEP
jgi:GT2 family glycosyltransferase